MPVAVAPKEELVTITRSEYDRLMGLSSQLAELQRMIFGRKSERFIGRDDNQTSLFGSTEETPDAELLTEQVSYQRTKPVKEKQKPVRALLPAHLPREEQVIEPDGLEEGMKKIGEEVTEILEHIPGKLYVRRIVRPKYVKGKEDGVKVATLPYAGARL